MPNPPDPFWLILAVIALACVALFPIRIWRKRRHRYDDEPDGDAVPLAPHERRTRG